MCKVLEREGHQWAIQTINDLGGMIGSDEGNLALIGCLERGLTGRPPSYSQAVQAVIDQLRQPKRSA